MSAFSTFAAAVASFPLADLLGGRAGSVRGRRTEEREGRTGVCYSCARESGDVHGARRAILAGRFGAAFKWTDERAALKEKRGVRERHRAHACYVR